MRAQNARAAARRQPSSAVRSLLVRVVRAALLPLLLVVCAAALPDEASAAPARALSDEFCLNYWVADCPDNYDFYWRPNLAFSPGRPSLAESWVSVVEPMQTYYFYGPPPSGKHVSHDYFVVGWGFDWWVIPVAEWRYGDGSSGIGQVLLRQIAATSHGYQRSSYGRGERNPRGEPGFPAATTVYWWGDLWGWHIKCSLFGCWRQYYHLPMMAWQTQQHPVAVRQVLPMSVGY